MDQTGFGAIGYPNCQLSSNEWVQQNPDTYWKGSMIGLSPDASFLVVADDSEFQAVFYDKIGKDLVQRGPTLDIIFDSMQGIARLSVATMPHHNSNMVTTKAIKVPRLVTFYSSEEKAVLLVSCTAICERVTSVPSSAAHHLSGDGGVLAVSVKSPGSAYYDSIQVYSLENFTAPSLLDEINLVDEACLIMSIAANTKGTILAAQLHRMNTQLQTIHVFDRNGMSYAERDTVLMQGGPGDFKEPMSPMAMSSDGNTIGFGVHPPNFNHSEVHVYSWENAAWNRRGLLPEFLHDGDESESRYTFLSSALSQDGSSISVLLGNEGVVAYDWNDIEWVRVGDPVLVGGFPEYHSLSFDGSYLAIGAFQNGYVSGIERSFVFSTNERTSCYSGYR